MTSKNRVRGLCPACMRSVEMRADHVTPVAHDCKPKAVPIIADLGPVVNEDGTPTEATLAILPLAEATNVVEESGEVDAAKALRDATLDALLAAKASGLTGADLKPFTEARWAASHAFTAALQAARTAKEAAV